MADTPASSSSGFDWASLAQRLVRGDIAMGLGVLGLLVMLILPLPKVLLDVMLAVSICFSVLILMTALFIRTPLEFTAFPAILLVATMLRLGLNVASTRLILSEGQNGTEAAGDIIEAFGNFVMQGNFVIGIIVFIVLVIVNFVVITKGSGRIAEVAARFTLDAMPGKQMAIDADLSSGLITEDQARTRRRELEEQSNFFGAMDGASKFVRGDAMAGILITSINLIGGMIIGVAQGGMPFGDAASTYSSLTIGDGLVTQIPALVVSLAAGLLVTKGGTKGAANEAVLSQLGNFLQKMQKDFKSKADELKSIQAQAKTKIEKLQRDGELLGQDEVEKLRIDIAKLDSEYKVKAQALEKASARREAEEKAKLFKTIQDAVKKVATKKGYDMVIDISSLQYGKPEYNISEDVIKALK